MNKANENQILFKKIITKAQEKNSNLKIDTIIKIIKRVNPRFFKSIESGITPPIKHIENDWSDSITPDFSDLGKDHFEGFENEKIFHEILWGAIEECWGLQASTVKMIISRVAPDFLKELFERRPCVRKLKYVGLQGDIDEKHFFKIGKVYESLDFSGGTYSFNEYDNGQGRIGSCHFEWIEK